MLCCCCCVSTVLPYPSNGPCDVSSASLSLLQATGVIPEAASQAFSLSIVTAAPSAAVSSNNSSGSGNSTVGPNNSTGPGNSTGPSNSTSPNNSTGTSNIPGSSSSTGPGSSMGPGNSTGPSSSTGPGNSPGPTNSSGSSNSTGTSNSTGSTNSSSTFSAVLSYADFGNYSIVLSANLSFNASGLPVSPVSGWLIYATSVHYLPGSLSLNQSSSTWQTLSAANSQCTNVGVVDANSGLTLSYSLPLSVQWLAPTHLSGNVTFNALVFTQQNQYYFTVPSLTIPPNISAPLVTAPISFVYCNASTDGQGGMTFVCWFNGNDGGAFVSYIGMNAYVSADSATPLIPYRIPTSPVGSYPTYATFHFPLTVGQTYYFEMYAGNAVGVGPSNSTTLTDTQQAQSTSLPVSASSTSISAGGVFGIVVGCLAAIGLLYLAARFYTRKGHLRQHMQHIDAGETADDGAAADEEAADEDVMLDEDGDDEQDDEEEEEEEEEEVGDEEDGGREEDLESRGEEHDRKQSRIQS